MKQLFLILGFIIALGYNGFAQDITTILPNIQEIDTANDTDFIYLMRPNTNYPNKLIKVEDLLDGLSNNAADIIFTPDGSIAADDVQEAIVEVRDEAANASNLSSGNVPGARNTSTILDASQWAVVDAGSNDTYVGNTATVIAGYTNGSYILLKPNTISTGTASINVWALGAKQILRHNGDALQDGDLQAGLWYLLIYDGPAGVYRLASGGTGAGTIIGSGTIGQQVVFDGVQSIADGICAESGGDTISCGDVSGNHYVETFSTATGTHTQNNIAQSGDRVLSTGARTNGDLGSFNSNGVLVASGVQASVIATKSAVGAIFVANVKGAGNVGVGTTFWNPIGHDFLSYGANSDSEQVMPAAGTVRNLYVRVNGGESVPASETLAITLFKNGSSTAVTCSIAATGTACNDTSNTVAFAAGDTWNLQAVLSGGATAMNNVFISFQYN